MEDGSRQLDETQQMGQQLYNAQNAANSAQVQFDSKESFSHKHTKETLGISLRRSSLNAKFPIWHLMNSVLFL